MKNSKIKVLITLTTLLALGFGYINNGIGENLLTTDVSEVEAAETEYEYGKVHIAIGNTPEEVRTHLGRENAVIVNLPNGQGTLSAHYNSELPNVVLNLKFSGDTYEVYKIATSFGTHIFYGVGPDANGYLTVVLTNNEGSSLPANYINAPKKEVVAPPVVKKEEPKQEVVVKKEEPKQEVIVKKEEPKQEVVVKKEEPKQEVVVKKEEPKQEVVTKEVEKQKSNDSEKITATDELLNDNETKNTKKENITGDEETNETLKSVIDEKESVKVDTSAPKETKDAVVKNDEPSNNKDIEVDVSSVTDEKESNGLFYTFISATIALTLCVSLFIAYKKKKQLKK